MLPDDFLADCPYQPEALLVARMPNRGDLPLTALQRAHPVRHPRHVSGGLFVHVTGMLGFAHAFFVLGLRPADGWIGYGAHIHEARWTALARIGPPVRLELRAKQVRRIRGSLYGRYAFRFTQEETVVYESEQGAIWQRVGDPAA